jgi:hypothetical protein
MTRQVYRGNLSAESFPLLSDDVGRTVIIGQQDQNFNRALTPSEDPTVRTIGIPQAYYMHNVMPTSYGYQSVSLTDIGIPPNSSITFSDIWLVRSSTEEKVYIGLDSSTSSFYSFHGITDTWTLVEALPPAGTFTVAHVSGKSYICIQGKGVYLYDFSTRSFTSQTLLGITATDILGIVSASGYLIAWTAVDVVWSSLLDPLDFVPSLITGAGGGALEQARGKITACVATAYGFVVTTEQNCILGNYSGNARYPFNFREIESSGGVAKLGHISLGTNNELYAYTTSGLQRLSTTRATNVFPAVTDFLAGGTFEDFDKDTNVFTTTNFTSPMIKRLAMVSDRYVIISYGLTSSLTHALVFDTAIQRWGKLRYPHVAIFEYQLQSAELSDTPKKSIALLQSTGKIVYVDFDVRFRQAQESVLILGKFQHTRNSFIDLDEIDLENLRQFSIFKLTALISYDGKSTVSQELPEILNGLKMRKFGAAFSGVNFSLILSGTFDLNTFILYYHPEGET